MNEVKCYFQKIANGSNVLLDGTIECQILNWYHTDNGGKYLVRVAPKCSLWVEASRLQLMVRLFLSSKPMSL